MRWSEDKTYKFVQEYLKHECLYSCKDPEFKIKRARQAALLQISEAMNIPGFGSKEAYLKTRSLRATYSQEVKKVRECRKSAAETDALYIPQLKWFKLLDDALCAINAPFCMSLKSDNSLDSQNERESPTTSQYKQYADKNNLDASPEPQNINNVEEEIISPISRKSTMRGLSRLTTQVKNVADMVKTHTQAETEFDIFGRSVAAQLKNMPLQIAIKAQMFIQNHICSLRLQEMGLETSIPSSPSTNYFVPSLPVQNSQSTHHSPSNSSCIQLLQPFRIKTSPTPDPFDIADNNYPVQ